MNNNKVDVWLYKNGVRITSFKNSGEITTVKFKFNRMMYYTVKKLVKTYKRKNANISVHYFSS